jgi:V8-like Glu-specific endopeptidase
MIGAILKLSYNRIGETPVIGGICGTCFLIHPKIALTANHVLAKTNWKPNNGYIYCQYWIILQNNTVVSIKKNQLYDSPEIDLTTIELNHIVSNNYINIANNQPKIGDKIVGVGYISEEMPYMSKIWWGEEGLFILEADASRYMIEKEGDIRRTYKATIRANDINIRDKKMIETSFASGVIGMSGGPILAKRTKEAIGLMSVGLPPDIKIKNQIRAISIEEIIKVLKGRGLLLGKM